MNGLQLPKHMKAYGFPCKHVHYRQGVVVSYHFQLPERLTLSVAFGYGNYCSNRDSYEQQKLSDSLLYKFEHGFKRDILLRITWNAEIAIWDTHHRWLMFDGDNVLGYVDFEAMPHIVQRHLDAPRQWFDYRLWDINRTKYYENEWDEILGMTFAPGGRQRLY